MTNEVDLKTIINNINIVLHKLSYRLLYWIIKQHFELLFAESNHSPL